MNESGIVPPSYSLPMPRVRGVGYVGDQGAMAEWNMNRAHPQAPGYFFSAASGANGLAAAAFGGSAMPVSRSTVLRADEVIGQ